MNILKRTQLFLEKNSYFFYSKYFVFFLFWFLVLPRGIKLYPSIALTIFRSIIFFIIFILFAFDFLKNKKVSLIVFLVFLYVFIRVAITFYTTNSIVEAFFGQTMISVFFISLFLDLNLRTNTKNCIDALNIYCESCVYINILCILFPSFGQLFNCGSYLNGTNAHSIYYIFSLLISIIFYFSSKEKRSKIRLILIWASIYSCVFVLEGTCATAKVALLLILFSLIGSYFFKRVFNIEFFYLSYLFAWFSIVLLRMQNYLGFFIEGILHKSLSFTYRTDVWDTFIISIKESPIYGHGCKNNLLYVTWSNGEKYWLYPHNLALNELYCGGIIQLLAFLLIEIFSLISLRNNEDSKVSKFLSCIIFGMLSIGITEALDIRLIISSFLVVYNFEYLNKFFINITK